MYSDKPLCLDANVPLGTTIVRIWGAEPSLMSVREDATRKSVAE